MILAEGRIVEDPKTIKGPVTSDSKEEHIVFGEVRAGPIPYVRKGSIGQDTIKG